jgi:hypothetical protein
MNYNNDDLVNYSKFSNGKTKDRKKFIRSGFKNFKDAECFMNLIKFVRDNYAPLS